MTYDEKYAKYYDRFNEGKDYVKEVEFVSEVLKKFGANERKILDLGCGTGLHEKEFSRRGYDMMGLDLSGEMIEIASERNPKCKFVVGDMSDFCLNEKFDAIISMFSAMGYLTENQQIEGFFNSVKKHLKENGLLVLDVWNGLGVMNELPISREKSAKIGNLKIVRRSFPDLDSKNHINKVRFNVKIFDGEKLIEEYDENHKVRFFFPQELKKYLEDAGFELLHLCPSYDLNSELTEKHWNMILVARLK
ncbi:methyltransferase domain-containing protein [Candidatus Pacearchaeota archaeon]|nr:methyltransferase domain-containing protein [Candidatus Pacearchaeota archaeon]